MKDDALPAVIGRNAHDAATAADRFSMPEIEEETGTSGLNVHEILFMLYRHKWKILFCAAAGMLASAAIYFLSPAGYESESKLFVRYVVDKSAVDGLDAQIKTPNPQTDTLINSEVEILTSSDLAREVAQAIGVDKLLPGTGPKPSIEDATQSVLHSLEVTIVKGTNIISIVAKSGNPNLPMPILQELVKRYFDKHLEVHRSIGAFEFVTKEAQELQNQLNQTESELKELKAKAGIISLAESTASLATELGKSETDLDTAQSELAMQKDRVKELESLLAVADSNQPKTATQPAIQPASGDIVQKYQSLVNRQAGLQQAETELLSKYTSENRLVKVKQAQIADLEKQRSEMEKKYPALIDTVVAGTSSGAPRPDLLTERARLVGMQSRVDALTARVTALKAKAAVISEAGPQIEVLERKREVEETNYKHSEASLEKARIDETLDPSRMPNISIVQAPSPAIRAVRDIKKVVLGLAAGGLGLGVALALLIEMVLDRTVKRSLELERRLRIPVLLSIPTLGPSNETLRLHDSGRDDSERDSLSLDSGELLRPFCEAIRDRLGLFFEMNNMAHKPKLVAVTGLAKNAGASTLAAGLASTLSEGTENKVLLVDKPVSPKRFYSMMAEFKSSDLDYVVFDMPSLGGTSSTLPLAGFMDTVLLVVEAGKSDRDAVKRAYAQLASKTKVSVVFNKTRSYGPKWLEGEL
jgi:polysaccharide biosynthesis transport protein